MPSEEIKFSHEPAEMAAQKTALRKILISEELFSGQSEVVIKHKNDFYRLMITKAGKLILNK